MHSFPTRRSSELSGGPIHDRRHLYHGAAAPQAIRVKNDHIFIGSAETTTPLSDVAGLAGTILRAPTIIDRDWARLLASSVGGIFPAFVLAVGIAENAEIEMGSPSSSLD